MSDSIAKPSHGFPSKSSKNNFILEKHYLDLTVFSIYLEDLKFEKEIPFNLFQNQARAKWINLESKFKFYWRQYFFSIVLHLSALYKMILIHKNSYVPLLLNDLLYTNGFCITGTFVRNGLNHQHFLPDTLRKASQFSARSFHCQRL